MREPEVESEILCWQYLFANYEVSISMRFPDIYDPFHLFVTAYQATRNKLYYGANSNEACWWLHHDQILHVTYLDFVFDIEIILFWQDQVISMGEKFAEADIIMLHFFFTGSECFIFEEN